MSEEYGLEQVAIRMVKMPPLMSKEPVNNPDAAIRLVNETLKEFDREAVVVVNLQNDLKPINMNFVSVGTLNASLAHPREILKASILSNAASIMLFHNHPTGKLEPSREDIELTDRLQKACKLMEIPLTDHIIIGTDDRYYSFHAHGIMPVPELKLAHDMESLEWEKGEKEVQPAIPKRKPSVRKKLQEAKQKEQEKESAAPAELEKATEKTKTRSRRTKHKEEVR